jgi:general secretion pathway protein A
MFLRHFKMKAHPFDERPPIDWLLKDERIAQGLARLEYFAHQGDIALIIGHTGVGKSSLLRLFIQSLSRNRYRPLYIHLTHINARALLRLIVTELGEVPKMGKDRLFLQIIHRTQKDDLATVLLIDEAHLIDPDALTDIRLLISSGVHTELPLKIILSGQEPLGQLLKRSSHADLVHRICVRYHLHPLTKEQSSAYIDSRMRCCGASEKVFEPEAKAIIHDYANGIPRQINNIATACLINAACGDLQKIDEQLVNQTMTEFHLP